MLATLWAQGCLGMSLLFPPCYVPRDAPFRTRTPHRTLSCLVGVRELLAKASFNGTGTGVVPDGRHYAHGVASIDSTPAGFGRRFAALLIDWLLSVLASTFFADPRSAGWPPVVVLILQYAIFVGLFGQTPGMAVARLRCVSYADGGAIGVPRALLRGVLLALFVPALIMDGQRRGLHDKAAGSIVVAALPRPGPQPDPVTPA
jgi:uncharacterized RDD family membrane protein YckC